MSNVKYINDKAKAVHQMCKKTGSNPQNLVSTADVPEQLIGMTINPPPGCEKFFPNGVLVTTAKHCLTHAGIVINGIMLSGIGDIMDQLKKQKQGDK